MSGPAPAFGRVKLGKDFACFNSTINCLVKVAGWCVAMTPRAHGTVPGPYPRLTMWDHWYGAAGDSGCVGEGWGDPWRAF
jgi:hypothetical protein